MAFRDVQFSHAGHRPQLLLLIPTLVSSLPISLLVEIWKLYLPEEIVHILCWRSCLSDELISTALNLVLPTPVRVRLETLLQMVTLLLLLCFV